MIDPKRKRSNFLILIIAIFFISNFITVNADEFDCKKLDFKCKSKKFIQETKNFQNKGVKESKEQINKTKEKIGNAKEKVLKVLPK